MSGAIVCFRKCWSCMFGYCYDEPTWHTWADADDIAAALEHGRPNPSNKPCACECCPPRTQEQP